MMFGHKQQAAPPITGWKITVPGAAEHAAGIHLTGSIYDASDEAAVVRFVDALMDGLQRAGYAAELELTRTTTERRP